MNGSTKATEYKELAAKGDKWESPVFSIGSASETSNLPRVSTPTRKPHSTNPGGLRDASAVGASGAAAGSAGMVGTSATKTSAPESGLTNGNSTNTAGFANQVDNAFTNNTTSQTATGADEGHTMLRENNPVYRGAA